MGKVIISALCFLLLIYHSFELNCTANHFEFASQYTLGKQEQYNRTFAKIQEKITTLNDVAYKPTETTTFTISKVKPLFYYRDSRQKAVVRGNDTIIISGGFLEVDFDFEWVKQYLTKRNGTGSAGGLSFELILAKKLIVDNGLYSYELLDSMPVTWPKESAFSLRRITPPDSSDQDKAIFLKMLNNNGGIDIKSELEKQIEKYLEYYLKDSLHDQHMPIDLQYDYTWVPATPGKNNVTLSLVRRPIDVDIQKSGIQQAFEVQIENDTHWKCGDRHVPNTPDNPQVYGGTQEFISLDFYQNIIRYAIQNNILDTQLNRVNWEGKMFQFFAGDLYEIIPAVQTKFFADTQINGTCRTTFSGLKIEKRTTDMFSVYLHYDCELQIKRQKIIDFSVDLNLTIAGHPRYKSIDFRMRSHQQIIKLYPYGIYKIQNEELAVAMIKDSLNRLYEGNLFGSGWPLYPARDYPHFITYDNYTLVYDSTHIDEG